MPPNVPQGRIVTLKGLMTIRRGGKEWRYLRIKGQPLVALPDAPLDSPEFLAAYAAARRAAAPPDDKGTLALACTAAMKRRDWHGLSPVYRQTLRRHIEAIRKEYGTAKVASLRPQYLRADVDRAPDPLARVKAWRWIFDGQDFNPAETLKRPNRKAGPGNTPWTAGDIAAFRARWPIGTAARAAMELLYWTGARIGDAVRLGPGMVGRDGVLAYAQGKTQELAFVPWTAPLPDYARHLIADRDMMHQALAPFAGHLLFLPAHGRQRSVNGFGTTVAKAARAASLDRSAHGLRHSRATALADAGGTETQIAAWTGHQSKTLVAHYTKTADRRRAVQGTAPERPDANPGSHSANAATKP
jgi:integrase/recombinase XerD